MSVESLRAKVRKADAAYRAGAPLMSDAEFDTLTTQLRTVAPHAPELLTPGGSTPAGSAASAASAPLLSLDNGDYERLGEWYATLPAAGVVVQPKIDGISLALRYENGILTAAWTRSGKSALSVAELVTNIPTVLCRISGELRHEGILEVYGELWSDDFKQSTPAAALRRKQPSGAGLNFTAYGILHSANTPSLAARLHVDEVTTIDLLSSLGFAVPDTMLCTSTMQVRVLHAQWSAGTLFRSWPTDGIVVKALRHDHQQQLGTTTLAPRWALALKQLGP
jgi:DNA ligase (NAD+)